jgi:hypothetical protein
MRRVAALVTVILAVSLAAGTAAWARPPQAEPPRLAFKLPAIVQGAAGATEQSSVSLRHLGVPNENINFGRLDPATGQIVDGDYLLFVRIELGDSPLSLIQFHAWNADDPNQRQSFTATPENPIVEGYATVGDGTGLTPLNAISLTASFTMQTGLPVGTLGTARMSFALVDDPSAKIGKLPAVSSDIDALIVDTLHLMVWPEYQLIETGGFGR